MFDAYGGSAFPGVGDILYNINEQVKIAFNKGKCQRMLLNHSTAQDTGSAEHTRLVKVLWKGNMYQICPEKWKYRNNQTFPTSGFAEARLRLDDPHWSSQPASQPSGRALKRAFNPAASEKYKKPLFFNFVSQK